MFQFLTHQFRSHRENDHCEKTIWSRVLNTMRMMFARKEKSSKSRRKTMTLSRSQDDSPIVLWMIKQSNNDTQVKVLLREIFWVCIWTNRFEKAWRLESQQMNEILQQWSQELQHRRTVLNAIVKIEKTRSIVHTLKNTVEMLDFEREQTAIVWSKTIHSCVQVANIISTIWRYVPTQQ